MERLASFVDSLPLNPGTGSETGFARVAKLVRSRACFGFVLLCPPWPVTNPDQTGRGDRPA